MSNKTNKTKWALVRSFRRSGRLWKNTYNGRYALADHSADDRYGQAGSPDDTDDGPQYVDTRIVMRIKHDVNGVHVATTDRNERATSVFVDTCAALYLAERFGIPIEIDEGFTYGVHIHRPCPDDLKE